MYDRNDVDKHSDMDKHSDGHRSGNMHRLSNLPTILMDENMYEDNNMNQIFAERLRQLREEQELTQAQLAEILGVALNTVSIWERGERLPKDELIPEIALALGVEMAYLFGLTDSREETRLSDEETAAIAEAEEQEITDWMIRKYKALSQDSQRAVRILVNGLWKADRDMGRLQGADSTGEQ